VLLIGRRSEKKERRGRGSEDEERGFTPNEPRGRTKGTGYFRGGKREPLVGTIAVKKRVGVMKKPENCVLSLKKRERGEGTGGSIVGWGRVQK